LIVLASSGIAQAMGSAAAEVATEPGAKIPSGKYSWVICGLPFGHSLVGRVGGFFGARVALGLGEGGNFPLAINAVAHWLPKYSSSISAQSRNVLVAAVTLFAVGCGSSSSDPGTGGDSGGADTNGSAGSVASAGASPLGGAGGSANPTAGAPGTGAWRRQRVSRLPRLQQQEQQPGRAQARQLRRQRQQDGLLPNFVEVRLGQHDHDRRSGQSREAQRRRQPAANEVTRSV
jgi:hypothetical protein